MSETKSALQAEAREAWRRARSRGTLAAATGVGKTKPAIDEMMELFGYYIGHELQELPKILVVVPTETLRDTGWPDEVKQWYGDVGMDMWAECVTAVCYISLHKHRGDQYDLVVLDEAHHLTTLSASFFKANVVMATLGLTATYPDQKEVFKYALLNELAPVCFTYPLEQGVEDGLVSDFEITVIQSELDDVYKIIPAGTKAKPYMTTEKKHYEYLSNSLKRKFAEQGAGIGNPAAVAKAIQFMTLRRARFIYDLPSKTKLAKAIIFNEWGDKANYDATRPRTLVFAGSIKQCGELCEDRVYHSKSDGEALKAFMDGRTTFLGCVNALNEGVNIPNLDQSIIVQASSNPREMVQRIGRNVRWREGHVAKIFILCVLGTQDESWVKNALASFSTRRIKYVPSRTYGV